jgi:glycosyltransferase involved in cell wall biosynthesis
MFERLRPVLDSLEQKVEILCIDDGSTDNTFALLCRERESDPRIKPVRLARNFGKEAALTCGLHLSLGEAAILMDSDLQHPPEVLPVLIRAWQGGAKMIYAIRNNRDTDGKLRSAFSKAFYALFSRIAEIKLPAGAGDFRSSRSGRHQRRERVAGTYALYEGLMTWVGFDYALVPFDVAERRSGKTTWNFGVFTLRLRRHFFLQHLAAAHLDVVRHCHCLVRVGLWHLFNRLDDAFRRRRPGLRLVDGRPPFSGRASALQPWGLGGVSGPRLYRR